MLELLAGSWLTATFVVVWLVLILGLQNGDWLFVGLLATAGLLVLHDLLAEPNISGWLWDNWGVALWCLLAYIPLGVGWSFYRWYLVVLDAKKRYDVDCEKARRKWVSQQTLPVERREWNFRGTVEESVASEAKLQHYRPKPNRTRIMTWITYWPWSVFWHLFDDLLVRLCELVYERVAHVYTDLVDRVFGVAE